MLKVPVLKDEKRLRGVTPWNRFLSLNGKTAPFHYWDPVWTFAAKEGLLVYPASTGDVPEYRARDIKTGLEFKVPFEMEGKVVRRIRLSHGVLIFEWCEEEATHPLNDNAVAHRHFATAYDVRRIGDWDGIIPRRNGSDIESSSWTFEFRSEWKIHYLGMPVSHQDRFFSTHNGTHYVVYIWQPTRSPWGEDEPLERLIIWDISTPSFYRPSLDPSGTQKPKGGARIIRSLANGQLREWGIRQSDTPSLRTLSLDDCTWDSTTNSPCGHVFFTEEEHCWSSGPHSSPNPPRLHCVKTTGIPLLGEGPRWVDECGGGGGEHLRFCWRGRWKQRMADVSDEDGECSAAVSVSKTWPGRAPCWRHDDFPYVTVSEVFDAAAGVRIIARVCFMLETLSVHVRPKIRVQGIEQPGAKTTTNRVSSNSSGSGSSRNSTHGGDCGSSGLVKKAKKKRFRGAKTEGPDGQEAQFADDVWCELMGKGFICGDERWLVGEDGEGDITILHF